MILVDFNPFGETTDGLLFTWSELKQKEDIRPSTGRVCEHLYTLLESLLLMLFCEISFMKFTFIIHTHILIYVWILQTIEEVADEEDQEGDITQYNERNLVDSNRQTESVIGDTYSFGEDTDTSPEFRYISDATGVQPSPYM